MIVDYSTLQQRIASWLARSDLASAIPDFIQLAEANLSRELRARQMMTEVAGTSVGGVITLPSDLSSVVTLRIFRSGQWVPIVPVPVGQDHGIGTLAYAYTVMGSVARLIGTQDVDYLLTYRRRIPALTDSAQTNWLITSDPGAYLYGALVEASPYLGDDARVQAWASQFQRIVDGINAHADLEQYGNAPAMQAPIHAP